MGEHRPGRVHGIQGLTRVVFCDVPLPQMSRLLQLLKKEEEKFWERIKFVSRPRRPMTECGEGLCRWKRWTVANKHHCSSHYCRYQHRTQTDGFGLCRSAVVSRGFK